MAEAKRVKLEWKGEKLEKLIEEASKEALKDGARTAMKVADKDVPVDTGDLKRSIHADGPDRNRDGVLEVEVEADARAVGGDFYAGYVEFGTRYMRAQPFMRPARDEAFDKVKTSMRKRVRQAAAKL